MMDGDVSHSSKFKLFTLGADVGGGVVCIPISFLCPFPFLFISLLCLQIFPFIVFLNQWGLIPEWVKPTAEGGGLLLIYFLSYLRCFCDFTVLLYVRFLFLST
jgi:hypothetical protein